ncbi:hypothetical protein CBR_g34799 [Chara braunii]|uniref:Myb/SANT-like DNA-binding domain-containing protein n=1 Tax=Chara braunii TaxID=69332 RepID=A0A388LJK1_CHABU|nr:hypothetical protein CBR_g34799 [Chara braunii]|eukprot:GBG82423.1 hypothetical protein CBR_g34799 [Chara braunii]
MRILETLSTNDVAATLFCVFLFSFYGVHIGVDFKTSRGGGGRFQDFAPFGKAPLRALRATKKRKKSECLHSFRITWRTVDGGAGTGTPGNINVSPVSDTHTAAQDAPSHGSGRRSVSPVPDRCASRSTTSNAQSAGRNAVDSRGKGQAARPPTPQRNTDRWAEDETTWLCKFRNEVKGLMGEDSESMGRARVKAGFWKIVESRMREKGFNRDQEQCKSKFSEIFDFYRKLKAHERRSGNPSYWDMNSTMRKRYNIDFVIRRSWYDSISSSEGDTDSIRLSNLRDSGSEQERMEDGDGETGGGSEDAGGGDAGPSGGTRSGAFSPTLGKRKRAVSNA